MSGMWLNAQPGRPVATARGSTGIAKRAGAERLPNRWKCSSHDLTLPTLCSGTEDVEWARDRTVRARGARPRGGRRSLWAWWGKPRRALAHRAAVAEAHAARELRQGDH